MDKYKKAISLIENVQLNIQSIINELSNLYEFIESKNLLEEFITWKEEKEN